MHPPSLETMVGVRRQKFASFEVLLVVLLSLSSTAAWQPSRIVRQGSKGASLQASTMLDGPTAATTTKTTNGIIDSIETESPRLSKARLLLEQFQNDVSIDDLFVASSAVVATTATTTTDVLPKNGSKQQQQQLNNIVPDSYWSNGHLEGKSSSMNSNGIVTRWARGVKVAEPLVKYDPVKAEKLLFRQPAKWLIRNVQIALPMGLWAAGVIVDYLLGQSKQNRNN
jgi:hypothetical protein